MLRTLMGPLLVLGLAATALAACSPDPPPAPMEAIPLRAPSLPPRVLLISLPGVAPVTHALRAELTRGGEAVCAPLLGTVLEPAGGDRFRVVVNAPGFAATQESVLRRTVGAPPGGPELALDGANNGRCDYVFRMASR
ncbi:hypothetical protein [Roseomonas indoligenes]|uniref:Lipoprotein n=1 Tax=Roseomonas indoligenes TaxID=2820811 RepID=A0A940MTQ1_9PROT|nr:hypothetical protein [Pararoseomonas indoligenes]MBP0493249.1 hypothetical protein [Pararoseomonas indoligenes]